ncbi:uncharacterized protein BJ171DRAFT_500805 [Polychytrium aggregatum]|uniref:uncharacterized protein n=1 Tax=Polychytrium aggregatum TaxID=110093 RepID=UPI0022FEC8BA|nr:uncharacterized protein BJ171DRAFT_500805 [Polychytrium aggregatum]KAI9205574.1 hypothetical protein BJ171DRAFT_500805 [Polychytrium aggregatum]
MPRMDMVDRDQKQNPGVREAESIHRCLAERQTDRRQVPSDGSDEASVVKALMRARGGLVGAGDKPDKLDQHSDSTDDKTSSDSCVDKASADTDHSTGTANISVGDVWKGVSTPTASANNPIDSFLAAIKASIDVRMGDISEMVAQIARPKARVRSASETADPEADAQWIPKDESYRTHEIRDLTVSIDNLSSRIERLEEEIRRSRGRIAAVQESTGSKSAEWIEHLEARLETIISKRCQSTAPDKSPYLADPPRPSDARIDDALSHLKKTVCSKHDLLADRIQQLEAKSDEVKRIVQKSSPSSVLQDVLQGDLRSIRQYQERIPKLEESMEQINAALQCILQTRSEAIVSQPGGSVPTTGSTTSADPSAALESTGRPDIDPPRIRMIQDWISALSARFDQSHTKLRDSVLETTRAVELLRRLSMTKSDFAPLDGTLDVVKSRLESLIKLCTKSFEHESEHKPSISLIVGVSEKVTNLGHSVDEIKHQVETDLRRLADEHRQIVEALGNIASQRPEPGSREQDARAIKEVKAVLEDLESRLQGMGTETRGQYDIVAGQLGRIQDSVKHIHQLSTKVHDGAGGQSSGLELAKLESLSRDLAEARRESRDRHQELKAALQTQQAQLHEDLGGVIKSCRRLQQELPEAVSSIQKAEASIKEAQSAQRSDWTAMRSQLQDMQSSAVPAASGLRNGLTTAMSRQSMHSAEHDEGPDGRAWFARDKTVSLSSIVEWQEEIARKDQITGEILDSMQNSMRRMIEWMESAGAAPPAGGKPSSSSSSSSSLSSSSPSVPSPILKMDNNEVAEIKKAIFEIREGVLNRAGDDSRELKNLRTQIESARVVKTTLHNEIETMMEKKRALQEQVQELQRKTDRSEDAAKRTGAGGWFSI